MKMPVSSINNWLMAPWSWRGFVVSLLVVAASSALQLILVALDIRMNFGAFFPAVFAAGFIGGKPAGAFAATLAIPLVWWMFLPPAFEFGPLTPGDSEEIKIFFLASILLVGLSDLSREIVALKVPQKH
jgi:K+-sensing histidine kinase KdpD